mgnify:FL=1
MVILSDRDLFKLASEQNFISPFIEENCEGATIDLTLGPKVKKYSSDDPIIPGNEITEDHYVEFDLTTDDYYIQPGESILIQTSETIRVPTDHVAMIFERYSIKSLGLFISPAHYMNPGFRGSISLLAANKSSVPIKLVPGLKICQLALFRLSSAPLKPYEKQDAKYMDATGVSISKLHLDKEIQEFLQEKGVKKVSDELARDLGDYLMKRIKKAAKELAAEGRRKLKEGGPSG